MKLLILAEEKGNGLGGHADERPKREISSGFYRGSTSFLRK